MRLLEVKGVPDGDGGEAYTLAYEVPLRQLGGSSVWPGRAHHSSFAADLARPEPKPLLPVLGSWGKSHAGRG